MFSCRVNIRFHIFLDPTEPGREAFLGLLQLKLKNFKTVWGYSVDRRYNIIRFPPKKVMSSRVRLLAETIVNNWSSYRQR